MRFQQKPYSCGAAAIVNALRCFGKRVPERLVRIRAGTTKENGTQEGPMASAIGSFGFRTEIINEKKRVNAFMELDAQLAFDFPVIICVQNDQHWVTVICKTGKEKYVVVDPSNFKYNKAENGIHILTRKKLAKLWKNKKGKYEGIVVQMFP